MKKIALLFCGLFLCSSASAVRPPRALLPIPTQYQVEWQKMETYAFVHFGLNTFNDREWGYGDSDPLTFNPTNLDCEQWVRTFVQAGLKGVILTAKHHDGFCLWPTKLTEYCIRNTPYKDGKGDVVGELAEACKKYGIKFALYLSPWDRHQANYGTPEYVEFYHAQLRELMTNYGEVFEVWFDGANGGDGWYGGANERRNIDRKNYYNYPRIYELLRELQPQAVVFSDGGPGCRWVGNEAGYAGATNWSFLRSGEVYPGYDRSKELQYGHADGDQWVAAECDVSIRPGWFYHQREDNKVKSVEHLTDLYYRSVGHNATLLLNFPVDKRGRIHPTDSAHAVDFHKRVRSELAHNLLAGVKPIASNSRGKAFAPQLVTDGDWDTYWATADDVSSATLEFRLTANTKINRILLQEYIPLGQRIRSFVAEYHDGKQWLPLRIAEECTTVGYKRLLRFATVSTSAIRIRFTDSRGPICINNVEAYFAKDATDTLLPTVTLLPSLPFTLLDVLPEQEACVHDNDPQSVCFVEGDQLIIDLGKEKTIRSISYLPDQSPKSRGVITSYSVMVGSTPLTINRGVAKGEFSNIRNNPMLQTIYFTPITTRYIMLKATNKVRNNEPIGIAELAVE